MAAIGTFSTLLGRTLTRTNVIYTSPSAPPTATSTPTSRLPATTSPPLGRMGLGGTVGGGLTPPTSVYPVNVDPSGTGGAQPISTFGGGTTGGGTATGFTPSSGGGTQPTADPSATSPGSTTTTATDSGTGSGGGSDTSRLLDLLAGAFQPQDIQQGYGPQSVSSDAIGGGSGTNPMAILIVAILAIAGVVWYTHRKKAA